jgi:hypothetical protein
MNHTPGTATSGNGGDLDPHQAAALLDQATQHGRRTFSPGTPALFVFRAAVALVIGGAFWLSVRGQDPYAGPTGAALPVWRGAGTCLAIAILGAAAGFGGPVNAWLIMGIGLGAVCLGYAALTAWRQDRSVIWP